MKKEIMPLYNNVILRPYSENPYVSMQSKDGLLLTDDQFDSQDSGETEKRDLLIGCAQVIEIGPECKYLQVGDDVFYNTVTVTKLCAGTTYAAHHHAKEKTYERNYFSRRLRNTSLPAYHGDLQTASADL